MPEAKVGNFMSEDSQIHAKIPAGCEKLLRHKFHHAADYA